MAVFLEGIQVNTVSTAAGQYAINAYLVDVLDGQLTLKLVDLGGTNANIVINGLEISYQAGSASSISSGRLRVRATCLPWPRCNSRVSSIRNSQRRFSPKSFTCRTRPASCRPHRNCLSAAT